MDPSTDSGQKPYFLNVKRLRQVLIAADDLMHFAVATILMISAAFILIRTLPNFWEPGPRGILHVLNDVLLTLIIMELMWPIVRFLKRKPFSLNPFLYIGIISATRRILLIEAEHSLLASFGPSAKSWNELWPVLAELGTNVGIILALALALWLVNQHEHAEAGK